MNTYMTNEKSGAMPLVKWHIAISKVYLYREGRRKMRYDEYNDMA